MLYTFTAIILFICALTMWNTALLGFNGIGKYPQLRRRVNRITIISIMWLVLFEGLRWEIGTDWDSYYVVFTYDEEHHMDVGYLFLNRLIKYFTSNYTVFVLTITLFVYCVMFIAIRKYSPNALMSLCIYYCSMVGLWGCNRQILAAMICILSLKFIQERRLMLFMMTVFFACLFHKTAIIFIPAYFLFNLNYSQKQAYAIVLIAFIVGLLHLVNKLPFVEYLAYMDSIDNGNTDFSGYLADKAAKVSLMGSFKKILYVGLAIYVKDKVPFNSYKGLLTLYIFGGCLFLVFNGSVLQLFAGRGTLYYNIFECIVMPWVVYYLFPNKKLSKNIWFFLFVVYFYLMWRDMNSYFILDGIDIYNPYKSVFSKF